MDEKFEQKIQKSRVKESIDGVIFDLSCPLAGEVDCPPLQINRKMLVMAGSDLTDRTRTGPFLGSHLSDTVRRRAVGIRGPIGPIRRF
jgi:hypothetical protein